MSQFLKQLVSLKTAIVSAIETVGIAGWKALLATATFALTGNGLLAIGVLAAGFILEHVVSFLFRGKGEFPLLRLLGVAAVETVTWSGWLALTAVDPILAAIVLFIGLWAGHGLEQNTIRGCPGFLTRIIRGETADITAIETGTAIVWLALTSVNPVLAVGVLFVGLQVEHALSNAKTPKCYS